jgi:CheY-like chemotaxis protein
LTRETERRYLAQLDDLAQTLASMLDDAGDLSRIASGALQLHVEPVDVRAILHRCTALAMESIGEREVRILTDVDVGVPLVLMTDGARLAQVLSILLAGAVRATRRGTVRVAAAATAAGALRIVVSDQGAGLAGGEFESPTLPRGGTRLADALARELAVLMGGACWVDREVGVGSTASLEVPLHTPAANAAHGFAPRAPLRPERQYPGTHVLVIDGNEINGLVIQAVLALRGAQTQVLTGIEQLATLGQGTRIDLAIVDADAPSSDVARAAAAIRGLDSARAAPVIAFAAQKPDWFQKGGTPAGVVDWLPKPPSEAALLSMMERWAVAVPAAAET